MATLLVSAAANLAVGFALNALFPPDDIENEGPRLADLGFTSAAYGKFINITFGTDRVDGNMIDTQSPAIEERVQSQTESAGKGGGQDVTTTTYSYFFTGRVSMCIEGAQALVRLWGDGKLIYDATGTSAFSRGGSITFYPGGENQAVDAEEESRRGVGATPAYRHLTTIKIDNLPLADFGNTLPNLTAELTFNPAQNNPLLALDEPVSGLDVPGSAGGGDRTYMLVDTSRNRLYGLKNNSATGIWSANASDLTFIGTAGVASGFAEPTAGLDGFVYRQSGTSNHGPLEKVSPESGAIVATVGNTSIVTTDDSNGFSNSGSWGQLYISTPGLGFLSILVHLATISGPNGSVVDAAKIGLGMSQALIQTISSSDGFDQAFNNNSAFIPDHDRGVGYVMSRADSGTTFQLMRMDVQFAIGVGGVSEPVVSFTELRRFTRGDPADDFESSADFEGWAVDRETGRLLLSNGANIVLYDPQTDTIVESRQDIGFLNRNNFITGDTFGFANTNASSGTITVIDPRSLVTLFTVDTATIAWPPGAGNPVVHDESVVWEPSTQSMVLSRVDAGTNAPVDGRLLKVFVNRVTGQGVGLDTIVSGLCTEYQRLPGAGLDAADIDVTTLAGDNVEGYTINRRGTVRQALEPLRTRFFFDGVQSDWSVKFPKRGGSSVLTVAANDVGQLRRGRDATTDPAIKEVRTQDRELPMRLSIRYKNKNTDYNVDVEHSKRHQQPLSAINSDSERTLDVPIVDLPVNMKQTAEKWLYTTWAERRNFRTILPWTYLELDPTDVFNLTVFNEIIQMRMGELDVGKAFAMEVSGVAEDVTTFSSTAVGGIASGFNSQSVPSVLPTRLVLLDAPLLSLADLQLAALSNAYVAFGAFDDGWPGATAFKSQDDVTFNQTAVSNSEAAIGVVRVAPSGWPSIEDDFRNRFQEVVDGGTMDVTVSRNSASWVSATETLVLNGANVVAAVTANGVEVFQFQDATINDDGTVTLDRLLRGRLGTEDVVDAGGIAAGDTVVLLSDDQANKLVGSVRNQTLGLSELDTALFFRGVTIGTLLEEAASTSFTYTGRDLQPYSVVHLTAVDTAGDLVVDWERRARGPSAGEWLDGTGAVPLNETIEQYVVTVDDGVDSIERTVDDATTTTFTAAELSTASVTLPATVTVVQVSGASAAITSPPTTITST